ncbi:MAG: LLM class F420-dependent oxidoreductase [Chloroflexi bacterium]|nr:LLM class F420-dependent oxidoreductase [Chloroflexota bacterium]MCZ7577840.1 LLM class F420-dependent oxidoreductase [Dehalococcoidia bacterium]NJD65425.1 LLM class F420-dependent oxidoreductase [Chloroflexota bacterium]PWB69308.1 MAG: LLM class F420-dependent oxidoreductase [Holophagae bacterium]
MRFGFWPGPNNSWNDTLALAKHAEAGGWHGVWYADHFMPNAEDTSGPTSECWTTLAALAASVPRIRLGALVTGNTYRHPAVLAKMAANVDNISGGRCVLGLGAGWQENEHRAYGINFSTLGGRMNRFEEACQVVTGLFSNEQTTFAGKHYQLTDAPLAPKPVQKPLPLLIGGGGEQRTLRIAAKYANEWNVWGTPEVLKHKGGILDQYCREIGRDPKAIAHSAQGMLMLTDDAAMVERMKAAGRPVIGGNGPQVRALVEQYAEAGVDELIIPDFNLGRTVADKTAVMDRFANEVMAHFR